VGNGAAQGFRVDLFADSRPDEVGPGKENGAVAFDHQSLVAHYREIGAACDAGAHYNRDLGNTHGAHAGVVAKDAPEMLLIREDFVLHGQENAGAVDEIDYRQMVLHCDLLEPQVFFPGDREPCARFHGLVVSEDHALAPADRAQSGDGATGGAAALLLVHFKTRESADLDKGRSFVDEVLDPLAGGQFVLFPLLFYGSPSAAEHNLFQPGSPAADGAAQSIIVLVKIECLRVHKMAI